MPDENGKEKPIVSKRNALHLLRYPGGKGRMLSYLADNIPGPASIKGLYVEPFVGGGAIFFNLRPKQALLADINKELMDLYAAIRRDPQSVWRTFQSIPEGKDAYLRLRKQKPSDLDGIKRAARLLYLNRTCFKGMWRYNGKGEFNIGYGGPSRRWVITAEDLDTASTLLRRASLLWSDFEEVIDQCEEGDFIFADPPYRPSHRELTNQHYVGHAFTLEDQLRLAAALERAEERGVMWTLTNSSHPDILSLYPDRRVAPLPLGTGPKPGALTYNSGEVIIASKGT